MSAVLSQNTAAPKAQRSEGVWAASWRRMRADKVGMVCMTIVALFLLLVIASGSGLVAKNWQKEVGVPNAPPTLMGPAPAEATGTIAMPKGPNVDLSDIDPLAPATRSGTSAPSSSRPRKWSNPRPCPSAATAWAATCWPR